jgi:glycosyltransferase involved in cell wall biosynthesis
MGVAEELGVPPVVRRADVMRVALVTHGFDVDGGTSTLTTFLYSALQASGRYTPSVVSLATSRADAHSVRLASPRTWGRAPRTHDAVARGIAYVQVGAYAPEFEFQRYRPRRPLTALLEGFDAVQFVVGIPPWLCVAADLDVPVFLYTATTLHADRLSRLRVTSGRARVWMQMMTKAVEPYQRRALARADFVFALSAYTRDSLRPFVDASRMAVAPCGVDTGVFRPAPGRLDGGCVLCVGRFEDPRKNVRLLIDAYAALVSAWPDAPRLMLAGSALPPKEAEHARALGVMDRIVSRVQVSQQELASLYQQASLFVLPSDEEGLGIVVLEAMASGLPVVSTRCGGPEMLVAHDRSGLLVGVGDVQALAAAMQRILQQPEMARAMGTRGRAVVERHYSVSAAGDVFLRTYDARLQKGAA